MVALAWAVLALVGVPALIHASVALIAFAAVTPIVTDRVLALGGFLNAAMRSSLAFVNILTFIVLGCRMR